MSNPAVLYVLRGPAGYLGRSGPQLCLTAGADLRHASPYATHGEADREGARAMQILGVAFEVEGHAVADLRVLDSRKS